MKTRIYTHPSGLQHDTGPGHPESSARLQTLLDLFAEQDWPLTEAPETELAWLYRVHQKDYVMALELAIPENDQENELRYVDADTVVCSGSWEAALTAAGAVCQAVDDVLSADDQHNRAFCAIRPPGHHAGPMNAEGFCLFNNIMIGARHALSHDKIDRVAVIDFDVHHGNGSDEITRAHDNIFYASTHQFPLYPGTGLPEDNVENRVVNVPLFAKSGAAEFRAAYTDIVFPQLESFAPDLLMISAGFDAHQDDPVGGLNLIEDDYRWITEELAKIADKHCGGKIVSALEGGYDLNALKSSVFAHIEALNK